MLVKELMHKQLFMVNKETLVTEAAKQMTELNIGILVIGSENSLEGVFSERDLMTKVVGTKRKLDELKIDDVMTKNVLTINENESFDVALSLMDKKKFRHLPVVDDNGKCVGMLGIRDLMGAMLNKIEVENSIMVEYLLAVSRVASILLELNNQYGVKENELLVVNGVAQEDLENLSDTSKEGFEKIIKGFESEKIASYHDNKITIFNKEKLEKKII
ncbi:MAG: CBS domain-containing protein [Candidatus Sericytochromatia bacterium]